MQIEREAGESRIHYRHHDDTYPGYAEVRVISLKSDDYSYARFLDEGQDISSVSIMYLAKFYPNGARNFERDYQDLLPVMRQGRGTKFLDMILSDARSLDVDILYTLPETSFMCRFLRKKGFQQRWELDPRAYFLNLQNN